MLSRLFDALAPLRRLSQGGTLTVLRPVTVDQMSFGEFSAAWLEAHRVDLRRIHRDEIVGIGHVQREVASLIGRLRNPELVRSAGADLPRGILFHGSPGTGKTLTARSLALQLGEDVPFYELSSDEVSPDRARMALRYLADHFARSVLYIDEVDGFALHRDAEQQTTTTRAVLVAFLAALDGLVESEGPIVIASSNRQPWQLDPALTRPGRLGFAVAFDEPDEEERVELFELFARRRPVDGTIDWRHLAQLSRGQSPAALRQALDDALGLALADGRTAIRQGDVLEALRRQGQVWPEVVLDADEVRRICVHEAGHVAAGVALLGPSYVYSVDVTERGGVTHLGKDEQNHITIPDSLLRAQVVFGYAGIAAEQVVFGEHSRPSDDDIEAVTDKLLGRIEHGLDEHFPPVAPSAFAERLAESLRERLMSIVVGHAEEAQAVARRIVADNSAGIKSFAEILYEQRPLTGDALQEAIARAGFVQLSGSDTGWAG